MRLVQWLSNIIEGTCTFCLLLWHPGAFHFHMCHLWLQMAAAALSIKSSMFKPRGRRQRKCQLSLFWLCFLLPGSQCLTGTLSRCPLHSHRQDLGYMATPVAREAILYHRKKGKWNWEGLEETLYRIHLKNCCEGKWGNVWKALAHKCSVNCSYYYQVELA